MCVGRLPPIGVVIMMFRPMLAGKAPADLSLLRYPLLASPKLDGIRCHIHEGEAKSRSMKLIPNVSVREALEGIPDGIDGELMVLGGDFSACSSLFMSRSKTSHDWIFYAFDWHSPMMMDPKWCDIHPFHERLSELVWWSENNGHNNLRVVEHIEIHNAAELTHMEQVWLEQGFEGAMVRDPYGRYKYGRSTVREGGLLKIKQFADEEMVVIGFEERMHNDNPAEKDAFGRTKRSTSATGKRPAGDMGVMIGTTMEDGATVELGTGFTAEERVVMWNMRTQLLGRIVKFKHLPAPGGRPAGTRPRHPVYLGFRDVRDLDA